MKNTPVLPLKVDRSVKTRFPIITTGELFGAQLVATVIERGCKSCRFNPAFAAKYGLDGEKWFDAYTYEGLVAQLEAAIKSAVPADDKNEEIEETYKNLSGMSYQQLTEMVRIRYKVIDLKGATKQDLVFMVLESKFSEKHLAIWGQSH